MIYLTGDTHGSVDVRKLLDKEFQKKVTEEDYLIICGDFGFIWNYKHPDHKEKQWLHWFEKQKFTTLFVDGNHECFPRLNAFPEKEWHGGKIHEINSKVFHLMRGQVFEIDGETFFTMGGAGSHDRGPVVGDTKAVIGKYWWPEEIPSEEELNEGLKNLKKVDYHVDYIITHCLPTSDQYTVKKDAFKADALTDYLEVIKKKVTYTHWYCGHYHKNIDLCGNVSIIFNRILLLGETVAVSLPIIGSPIYHKGDWVFFWNGEHVVRGQVVGIYPWGRLRVNDQALYDIMLPDGETLMKHIKEEDTWGYSCI